MNLTGDEKRIQHLFREMSRDDERGAPEFAGVVEAARSGTAGSRNRTRSFVLALGVAVTVVAMLIALSLAVRHPKAQPPTDSGGEVALSPPPVENPGTSTSPQPPIETHATTVPRTIRRRVPRRRTLDELAIRIKSLSAWQSPTASLLKAPGEELLKSLPRLGESLQSIKSISPDQFN
jgi:hypothetical protein